MTLNNTNETPSIFPVTILDKYSLIMSNAFILKNTLESIALPKKETINDKQIITPQVTGHDLATIIDAILQFDYELSDIDLEIPNFDYSGVCYVLDMIDQLYEKGIYYEHYSYEAACFQYAFMATFNHINNTYGEETANYMRNETITNFYNINLLNYSE